MYGIDKIKFSVVIPTRERCNTLDAAIRTCVTQDYDNFEIIVSDNFSQDDTKEVVNSFRDKRIIYVNTGKRLAMADNWEFGLSQVTGNYVLFLGDDDGLLPGALKDLSEIINRLGCDAISWNGASYYWPCCIIERAPNMLVTPLNGKLYKRNAELMLRNVLSFKKSLYELPSIYRGVVSRSIIEHIKERSDGKYFHSMSPDIYSAIVLAASVDTYYYSTKPYSVFGQSQHSTGASYLYSEKQSAGVAERKFFNEPNIPCHDKLVLAPSILLILANTFLQAQEQYSPLRKFDLDLRELIGQAIKEVVYEPQEKYEKVAAAIKEIARINSMGDAAERILKNTKNVHRRNVGIDVPGYNVIRHHFVADCTKYGVYDVYQASLLCKVILEYKNTGMCLSLPSVFRTTIKLAENLLQRWRDSNNTKL